jgi:hypothetical protein
MESEHSGVKLEMDLRKLEYSPRVNPLVEAVETQVTKRKSRYTATGINKQLMDAETGEVIEAQSAIITRHEVDDQHFVKVFADGVKAAYDLSKTAHRVFTKVIEIYEATDMHGGYADSISLAWFDRGLHGEDIGMSQQTFSRGLKELIQKRFLAPKMPNEYWVNPALFFKGDRVAFVKEYRRVSATEVQRMSQEKEGS